MSAEPDASPALDPALVASLGHEIGRHARLMHVLKGSLAPLVPEGLDMGALTLLFTLARCGPRRQGELAESALLDPSTVSRHVAALARAGYVQRRPDPQDGRAVQLVASDEGVHLARTVGERRQAAIAQALAAWDPDDVRTLVRLLTRFDDDLDAFRPHLGQALLAQHDPQHDTHHDHDGHYQESA